MRGKYLLEESLCQAIYFLKNNLVSLMFYVKITL